MINSKTLCSDFVSRITIPDDESEIQSIVYLVFEQVFGLTRSEILSGKTINLNQQDENKLAELVSRINRHEPIQYILNQADFFGRTFFVNPAVLIPRPETEELVREVLSVLKMNTSGNRRVLDIGTGSGCIPITLSLELVGVEMHASDISLAALEVAARNASNLKARVEFFNHDVLASEIPVKNLDCVVSNPPYISVGEKSRMHKNVLDFEPHLALFANEDDPLIFYRHIASKAKHVLKPLGWVMVEINSSLGVETKRIFEREGYRDIELVKDISGNDRIIKGRVTA
jgi:release factor glutamine methyltransferase